MKATLFLSTTIGAVLAQDLSGQPPCATSCLSSAISAAGCAPNDLGCQCGPTQSVIIASAVPCLVAACQPADLGKAQSAGEARCAAYKATATEASLTATGGGVTLSSNSTITTQKSLSGTTSSAGFSSTGAAATTAASSNTAATTAVRPSSTSAKATTSTIRNGPQSTNGAAVQTGAGVGLVAALLGAVAAL